MLSSHSRVKAEESSNVKYNVPVSRNRFNCPSAIAEELLKCQLTDSEQPVAVIICIHFLWDKENQGVVTSTQVHDNQWTFQEHQDQKPVVKLAGSHKPFYCLIDIVNDRTIIKYARLLKFNQDQIIKKSNVTVRAEAFMEFHSLWAKLKFCYIQLMKSLKFRGQILKELKVP